METQCFYFTIRSNISYKFLSGTGSIRFFFQKVRKYIPGIVIGKNYSILESVLGNRVDGSL
jgi:hypothetical protein